MLSILRWATTLFKPAILINITFSFSALNNRPQTPIGVFNKQAICYVLYYILIRNWLVNFKFGLLHILLLWRKWYKIAMIYIIIIIKYSFKKKQKQRPIIHQFTIILDYILLLSIYLTLNGESTKFASKTNQSVFVQSI